MRIASDARFTAAQCNVAKHKTPPIARRGFALYCRKIGAGDRIRTGSPLLGKQMRYHCATPARTGTVAVLATPVKIAQASHRAHAKLLEQASNPTAGGGLCITLRRLEDAALAAHQIDAVFERFSHAASIAHISTIGRAGGLKPRQRRAHPAPAKAENRKRKAKKTGRPSFHLSSFRFHLSLAGFRA